MNALGGSAAILGAAIAVPHLAPLDRVRPLGAAIVWSVALSARAIVAVGIVLTAVICLPDTPRFAGWLREFPHHVIAGVGDTELALGALPVLAAVAVGRRLRVCRRELRTLIRPLPVTGPGGSVVVGDGGVLLAAVGWRQPAIVVSAGALAALDDDELAAGLAHEQGHISRAHRWWQIGAETCRVLCEWLPGTARAAEELSFHLERDADLWAVEHDHDPRALAGAVCKAALAGAAGGSNRLIGRSPAYAGRRVRLLLEGCPTGTSRGNAVVRAGALVMAGLVAGAVFAGAAHFGSTLVRCHITGPCSVPASVAHR